MPETPPETNSHSRGYRFGLFELDLVSQRLLRQDQVVRIQEKPFQLLAALVENAGEVISREQLRARLWPSDTFVQFDDNLNTTVKRVREALSDSAERPRYIETVPRRGYRFIPPVERLPAEPEPLALLNTHSALFRSSPSVPLRWVFVFLSVIFLAAGSWYLFHRQSHALRISQNKIMLAVLPFRNLSGSSEQDYLSDGFTEELIAHLGRLAPRKLGVIAQSSVAGMQSPMGNISRAGHDLGVSYILEGSVSRIDGQVNVTARLVQVNDQTQAWAETYARPAQELLTIERDVAKSIAEALAIRLLPSEENALARAATTNTEAYEAYLAGVYQFDRGTEQSFRNALTDFERAINLDPEYAMAHDAIAKTYLELEGYHFLSSEEAYRKAQEHVALARKLDDDLPQTHALLAALLQKMNPHSPGIGEAYRKAIELNPSDAYVRQEYALYLLSAVKQPNAAIAQILEGARLDPLSVRTRCYVAWIFFSAGRFREAQEQVTRALALDPNSPFGLYIQGHLFEHNHRLEAAVMQFQKAVNSSGRTPKYLFTLADAYLQAGRKGDAGRILAELQQQSKTQYVSPDYLRRLSDQLGK
ncbi:MAG TPA: winged helix-turn-helix domain-containing protein [Bryobacteraceae bacterium]|jgi:TolB-like protein/DNA-binding winged helix-turn-helix (wHTH) protein/Flp pilus assembly protein TadD|nr:winged helix-turn-helix domain-containing protein [Bryobacteraceae bacterium]